jgi:predicted dehydrogenase
MCWNNELPASEKEGFLWEKEMNSEEVDFTTEEHIEKELRYFCFALENGTEPPVSGVDGLKVQRIVDAIYESGRTGKEVII